MATKIISGIVESNGAVAHGAGFQSTRVATGVYSIDFTQDFTDIPSVSVTPIGFSNNYGYIRHIFTNTPSSGQFIVYSFYDPDAPQKTPNDTKFSFIAVGEE